jgi:hypothetical protein
VDKIVEVLPLDDADTFEAGNAVVPNCKCFLLNPPNQPAKREKSDGSVLVCPREPYHAAL